MKISALFGPRELPWDTLEAMNTETLSLLSEFLDENVVILGFGNRLWADDGAGSIAAEALGRLPGLTAIDAGMTPENHLETVARSKPAAVLLIDATDFGGHAGEMKLIGPDELAQTGISTHSGSPAMLARYLEARCGAKVALLAIQPAETHASQQLSNSVASAIKSLVDLLAEPK